LFLCALFSKTIASSMPLVALMIIWWKRGKIGVKDVLPLLPLLVVEFFAGMLTAYMEKVRVGVAIWPQDWIYAATPLGQFGARCIIAGKVFWFYLGKIIYPHPLIFNYARWRIDASQPLQYLPAAAAIVVLSAVALSRKRLGGAILVSVFFYSITLFPAMGFIDVWPMRYSFVADHFVYLSAIGVIALIAGIAAKYLPKESFKWMAAVVLATFFVMTWNQGRLYSNLRTLWEETIRQTHEQSWFAMNNYGAWIRDEGPIRDPFLRLSDAEMWFDKVLQLKPDYPEAQFSLAVIAERRAALAKLEQANKIPTTQPSEYEQQAIDHYQKALAIQPNYIDAHFRLGELLESMGHADQAAQQYRQTVALYPRHEPAHERLGNLLMKNGKVDDAIAEFQLGVDGDPDSVDAHKALGKALLVKGDVADGLDQWETAMRLSPDDWRLPNEFGVYMANSGEYPKAVDYFKRALNINLQAVEPMTNLGVVAAKTGFAEQARTLFKQALAIDPEFAAAKRNLDELNSGKLLPATRPATQPKFTAPQKSAH
jgi:Tfp pilus assembly protein PilF